MREIDVFVQISLFNSRSLCVGQRLLYSSTARPLLDKNVLCNIVEPFSESPRCFLSLSLSLPLSVCNYMTKLARGGAKCNIHDMKGGGRFKLSASSHHLHWSPLFFYCYSCAQFSPEAFHIMKNCLEILLKKPH